MKDPGKSVEDPEASGPEQSAEYTITDLEQIKVVADPLRLRILETLAREEQTTKQVAQKIGEKPTRLYHHVDALERVGLIRLTRTRPNRGTVEKYYMAVARCFKAGSGLFSAVGPDSADREPLESVTDSIFENTAREMRELITSGGASGIEEEGILTYAEVHADPETAKRIQSRLTAVLEEFRDSCCEPSSQKGLRRFRLTLAYFPLDRGKP